MCAGSGTGKTESIGMELEWWNYVRWSDVTGECEPSNLFEALRSDNHATGQALQWHTPSEREGRVNRCRHLVPMAPCKVWGIAYPALVARCRRFGLRSRQPVSEDMKHQVEKHVLAFSAVARRISDVKRHNLTTWRELLLGCLLLALSVADLKR
ncbi:hypothetical protein V2G26_020541 [Clonostachys chloroleuca]